MDPERKTNLLTAALAVVVAAFFLWMGLGMAAASPAGGAAIPAAAPSPAVTVGVQVTETSSEVASFASYETLWHNSTSVNASSVFTFPANMTLYPASSTFSATLTVSAGAYLSVLKVYQGSTVFLNSTVVGQVTASPTASTTPLSVKVLQLFQQSGAAVPLGTYHVWVNVSEAAYLSTSAYAVWSQAPLNFSLAYPWSAPYGYRLNQTTVFVPFPGGVSVNFTSATVANATTPQVTYAGVYAYNTSLAPGKSLTFTASFAPYPIASGPATLVSMSKPTLEPGSTTVYASTGNWSNSYNLPYEGIYVLTTGFAYTIDPGSVTLKENAVTMKAGQFTVGNNNTIIVIPGTLTVGKGQGVLFALTFSSLASPPAASLIGSGGHVLFALGTAGFTLNDLLYALMLLAAVYLTWGVAVYAEGFRKFVVHGVDDRVSRALNVVLARSLVVMLASGVVLFLVG